MIVAAIEIELSIKPEYAMKIFRGLKDFEFRKSRPYDFVQGYNPPKNQKGGIAYANQSRKRSGMPRVRR